MDFGSVLHKAQRNEKDVKSQGVRYYSTKFEPPKKEKKEKRELSENVKKFLARKEAEERGKRLEAQKKKDELLALRALDKKSTRRVNVMLKRTKSANKSVIQDAVDDNNTSVTLAGPIQPDEDDYGYVSQESAAYYNKLMEKYSKMPDEPKFNFDKKKKVSTNLSSTKDRVKAALEREREEASIPHKRKRKHKEGEVVEEEQHHEEPEEFKKPKTKPKPPPPTLNFNELLKLAEKKQFEPIIIEQKPKEEEKPLTKKQKKELEREKEWRDRREGKLPPIEKSINNKIPKLSDKQNTKPVTISGDCKNNNSLSKPSGPSNNINSKKVSVNSVHEKKLSSIQTQNLNRAPEIHSKKTITNNANNGNSINKIKGSNVGDRRPNNRENVPLNAPSNKINGNGIRPGTSSNMKAVDKNRSDLVKSRDLQAKKQFPPSDLKPKQFPPKDLKPKQFPPNDVRRKQFPPRDVKRKPIVNKRRILDDDDEEYDSEMDDFIDDGPGEEEDYSKYISEIFGYDKSKYRNLDDDVDNMESTFAQQMREEVISTKIGIMEDLEDIKKEEEEKRRKALMKKKMMRK